MNFELFLNSQPWLLKLQTSTTESMEKMNEYPCECVFQGFSRFKSTNLTNSLGFEFTRTRKRMRKNSSQLEYSQVYFTIYLYKMIMTLIENFRL